MIDNVNFFLFADTGWPDSGRFTLGLSRNKEGRLVRIETVCLCLRVVLFNAQ